MSELRTAFQEAKHKRDLKMYKDYLRMSEDKTMPKMDIYAKLAKKYGLHSVSHTQSIILDFIKNENDD